jgi:hypothetical protein
MLQLFAQIAIENFTMGQSALNVSLSKVWLPNQPGHLTAKKRGG